ncbi:MAG: hypothetical protein ABW221_10720 [Vicinamibacteria bacterium]
MRLPMLLVAATAAGLGGCGSPDSGPAAPAPVPTPRAVSSPALVVTTAARSSSSEPRAAQLSVYVIAPDGRLVQAGPSEPIGSVSGVAAASYAATGGLYRQVLTRSGGPSTLVTYQLDLSTAVFTRLASAELPWHGTTAALHPNGRFLYAAAGAQALVGYELDPGSGALLRALPGVPFTWDAPSGASDLSLAPSGRFAWAHVRIPDGYHGNRQVVVSLAVDPSTGALRTTDETPVYDRISSLAVSPREDTAYLVDRSNGRLGRFTWRRFDVDGAGALVGEEPWGGDYAGGLHFTPSGRFLLSAEDGDYLTLVERTSDGRTVRGASIPVPRSSTWDARRTVLQHGGCAYVVGDQGIGVVRVDEPARALTLLQDAGTGGQEILSVVLAVPAP